MSSSPRVGLVVVSHSPALAAAAVALASEMVASDPPTIAVAAGTPEGETGTDAARIAEAIGEAEEGAGVVVLMDLGSAVMSAELALEFLDPEAAEGVRLVAAPFVEGLMAAAVRAAGGAALDEVVAEARSALAPKTMHLGEGEDAVPSAEAGPEPVPGSADAPRAATTPGTADAGAAPPAVADLVVRNVGGLHARPAAVIADAVQSFAATVTLAVPGKPPASAASPIGIAILIATAGTPVRVAATGPQAREAIAAVVALLEGGFGEELIDAGAPGTADSTASSHPTPAAGAPLGVSSGRVVGPAVVMTHQVIEPDADARLEAEARGPARDRLRQAMLQVARTMHGQADRLGGQRREVLEATAAIAADPALHAATEAHVRDAGLTPERAVWVELSRTAQQYREAGGRFAERATDIADVRDRIIAALTGVEPPGVPVREHPFILVADDLAPADTVGLDPAHCLAIVTEQGGPTSHTAILARELGLPAVVGAAGVTALAEGTVLLVDGDTGEVIEQPTDEQRATATGVMTLPPWQGPAATADGHRVVLGANVGAPRDTRRAVERGAEGVGLFRTEFCFLDRRTEPSIDDQVAAYREVFAAFPGEKVIVRTLDAGSDKPLPFLTADDEPNPALGVRGFRTARRDGAVLDHQLVAIARAAEAESAEVQVMAPMIATVQEAEDFVQRARAAGIPSVGVMIETPSAAMVADELMRAVDFVSIGTNDLSQYTMAADRQSGELAALADPWQPALLRMIRLIGAAGERTGTPVGICGESAADPALAPVLVGLGATSLSMSARAVTAVGVALGRLPLSRCRDAAAAACAALDPARARAAAAEVLAG
ncbi:phosphoenolpyruvate--protein phosphotransferase [Microcella flavibacter]|uniref:phosphoenolpyruvate--protein phosphotransferase n=1 Tax=Microcella flavibacter TaxID=1804990 RepID=UPI001456EA68|nr:phosphoenolpyruvate--protein phosphotransferase [Microcella flavibacter]